MRLPALSLLAFALAGCASTSAGGKPSSTGSIPVETVAPNPEDVGSVDGIMRAFYEVTNVAPDAPRQWSRDRTLYVPWIRFVALGSGTTGRPAVTVFTHQEFVDATEPLIQKGFVEREIFRATRRYGNMVHIDSTYEALVGIDKPVRTRGVNSLDLYFDGQRWWVASVVWQSEDAAHPIPPELLPPALR